MLTLASERGRVTHAERTGATRHFVDFLLGGFRREENVMKESSAYGERYAHKSIKTLRLKIDDVPGKLGHVTTAIGLQEILIGEVHRIRVLCYDGWCEGMEIIVRRW